MSTLTYTFYHLPNKEPVGLCNKIVQGYLLKWCVKYLIIEFCSPLLVGI